MAGASVRSPDVSGGSSTTSSGKAASVTLIVRMGSPSVSVLI